MTQRSCYLTPLGETPFYLRALTKDCVLVIMLCCLKLGAIGQTPADSGKALQSIAVSHAIHYYLSKLGKTIQLYNGAEYIRPFPLFKGSPYLEAPQKGAVYFDGVFYPDVMLAYDIVNQQLVTTGYQNINLTIAPEKIGYFYLSQRLFMAVPPDSLTRKKSFAGFYEVLNDQAPLVVAQYQKTPKRSVNTESATTFLQYVTYYLLKDNTLIKIDTEKALLRAFADQKVNVKQFLRSNHLQFKKAPAETLLKTVAFINQSKE